MAILNCSALRNSALTNRQTYKNFEQMIILPKTTLQTMRIIGARNELCVFIRDYAQEFSIGDVEKVSNLAKKVWWLLAMRHFCLMEVFIIEVNKHRMGRTFCK